MPAVQCDQCDHCFPAPAERIGQKVRCPKCKALVRVPPAASPVVARAAQEFSTGFHVLKWLAILAVIAIVFLILAQVLMRDAMRGGGL